MKPTDEGKDLETRVRELLADFRAKGIDCILAIQYLDGKDKAFVIKHTPYLLNCRKLCRMLWQALAQETISKPANPYSTGDDED